MKTIGSIMTQTVIQAMHTDPTMANGPRPSPQLVTRSDLVYELDIEYFVRNE